MFLPCSGISLGFCTAPRMNDSGPVTCCHSLFHSAEGVSISLRMRARIAGSFKRSIIFRSPPSRAHGGAAAQNVVELAGQADQLDAQLDADNQRRRQLGDLSGLPAHAVLPARPAGPD